MNKALEDLIFLGQITKTVTACGKRFEMRTLTSDEQLAATQSTQDYDPLSRVLALKVAILAKAIIAIDGEKINSNSAREMLAKVQVPIINKIYNEYDKLVNEQNDNINNIEEIKNSSTTTSQE